MLKNYKKQLMNYCNHHIKLLKYFTKKQDTQQTKASTNNNNSSAKDQEQSQPTKEKPIDAEINQ